VFIGASIGIAVAGADHAEAVDAAALLTQADAAAYRAKERGRNRYEVFDDDLRATVEQRTDVENGLRHAIEHDELRVLYQPIVAIEGGHLWGFEALVRWERDGRLVPPAEFLGIAEETGLIVPIGEFVLDRACREAARWRRHAPHDAVPLLGVNLSARELTQPDLAARVRATVERHRISPSTVGFEIREPVLTSGAPQITATLDALHDLGVLLSADNFGTGSSSLRNMRQLHIRAVKIDRSFVLELGRDHEGSMIVASVISLARALGMSIVAEGVETIDHATALLALGCNSAQGFLFSPPVDADTAFEIAVAGTVGQVQAA
jgi:EAL domain-containing protein (putative c-di-GMP-specific phosphodiesterase class I)